MKSLIFVVVTCVMWGMFNVSAEAQLINRLKKKAKDAAEQKAEEKLAERVQMMAERMVEKSWNSIFGEMNEDSLSGMRLPFKMNSNVTTEEQYTFDSITTMEIETVKKNGKSDPPVIMDMHFNKNEMYTGTKFRSEEMKPEDGELFLIYDLKNSAMLMLMSNEDEKFSFAYDWSQALVYADSVNETMAEPEEYPNENEIEEWQGYSLIGTKNILGYKCDGYRSETNGQVTELWVSRHADFANNHLFRANANTKQMKGKIPHQYPNGMLMEMSLKDSKSGDYTTMKITDIKKDVNVSYAMAEYPKMSFAPKAN